jgi:hypothetical protein
MNTLSTSVSQDSPQQMQKSGASSTTSVVADSLVTNQRHVGVDLQWRGQRHCVYFDDGGRARHCQN